PRYPDRLAVYLDLAPFCARQHEEVLDESLEAVRLALDVLERLRDDRPVERPAALAEHLREAVDRRDRGPQLVADHPDERVAQLARPDFRRVVGRQLDRPGE